MARAKAVESGSHTYTVVFEPDEEAGGYTVTGPALPGLVTEGDTLEQARERAAGAIRCYLESLRTDGRRLPLGEVHTKGCRYLFPVPPFPRFSDRSRWRARIKWDGRSGARR